MAEYLIQDTTLDAIADAINAKTGGSSAMTPAEMVTAIGSISGGGWTIDGIANGSEPIGSITINSATIRGFIFSGCNNISEATLINYIGAGGSSTSNPQRLFEHSSLTKLNAPKATGFGTYAIANCASLYMVVAPNLRFADNGCFSGDYNLQTVDMNGSAGITRGAVFSSCKKLQTLILRSSTLVSLGNVANFSSTPFAGTGNSGLTGTLYVPSALVESYKTASNWSTFYDGGTMAVLPIEGSIYETQYADGTPIPSA